MVERKPFLFAMALASAVAVPSIEVRGAELENPFSGNWKLAPKSLNIQQVHDAR